MSLLCRKSITPSQQVEEESARFLGISHNSPYLCIRFKIHTLEVSFLFHIAFVLGLLVCKNIQGSQVGGPCVHQGNL